MRRNSLKKILYCHTIWRTVINTTVFPQTLPVIQNNQNITFKGIWDLKTRETVGETEVRFPLTVLLPEHLNLVINSSQVYQVLISCFTIRLGACARERVHYSACTLRHSLFFVPWSFPRIKLKYVKLSTQLLDKNLKSGIAFAKTQTPNLTLATWKVCRLPAPGALL